MGGGHRVVFQHLNGLAARGHQCELWSLDGEPDWFELDVPVREFDDYETLAAALAAEDAIKVATWWATARYVWQASVRRGIPAYFVQDLETSYYPDDVDAQAGVLASYRPEFHVVTTSEWVEEHLRELGVDVEARIAPGLDLDRFFPTRSHPRRARAARARTLEPAEGLPAHRGCLSQAAGSRGRSCGSTGSSRSWASRSKRPITYDPATRGQRAAQHGGGVRADLSARGLLPAGARGDVDRAAGGVHRRARKPRLLPRRRELPHA